MSDASNEELKAMGWNDTQILLINGFIKENKQIKQQLEDANAENVKLRECVEFYADTNNWSYQQIIDDVSEVNGSLEGGKLARKTLKKRNGNFEKYKGEK